jgi:hypothetical protein
LCAARDSSGEPGECEEDGGDSIRSLNERRSGWRDKEAAVNGDNDCCGGDVEGGDKLGSRSGVRDETELDHVRF